MAVTYNMKGTSHPSFAIGKSGPRIFTSSSDPSGSETVSNSDLWIDTTDYQLKIRVSGAWKQVGETVTTLSASTLAITGDLTVSGTTTSINSTVLDVNDNKITLNSDYTADPTQDAGLVINRGTATDVELRWNETTDKWQFTEDGSTYITLRDPDLLYDTTPQLGGDLDANGNNIDLNGGSLKDTNDDSLHIEAALNIDPPGGSVQSAAIISDTAATFFRDVVINGSNDDLIFDKGTYRTTLSSDNPASQDQTITLPDASGTVALTSNIPTNVSDLTNDAGYITSDSDSQLLSFSNPNLTISSGNSVDLSSLDTMPSQTGHSGKFLTTDGTDPSWEYVLPEAGDDWGSIASSADGDIQFGALTGDNSLWNGLDLGYITEKIAHDDLSVTTASASGSGGLSYDSSTGVFTFTPAAVNTFDGTFSSLTGKPTTIAGYGITDAFDGAFGSLSGKPTTIAGYGITDALELGTSATTALAGNTSIPSAVSELSNDSAFITNSITTDFTLTSTDTGSEAGPIINLKRDSSSPANADYLGQIKFKGENSSGGEVNYAKITGKILDVTDGSEDGILEFAFIKGGSQNISGRFRSDQLQLLNGTKLYIGGSGSIQFEGDSSNAHETTINVTEPTQDNTITFPNSTGTVALTNSFSRFHSSAQTVTSSQETTNVSATVDFTFSELTNAIHFNVYLNRLLLRPTEFSVSGTTVTIAVGVLAQDDELEVTGFTA